MVKKSLITLVLASGMLVWASDSPQFRGPQRNGIFNETGLLKQWPENGPVELWSVEGLGKGYASVSVANGFIFTTGERNEDGLLHAFDMDGKALWSRSYGPVFHGNGYPGTRTTPTIDGDRVYVFSTYGNLACFEISGGKKIWEVQVAERFAGKGAQALVPTWGITESLLILDNKVICTPGAKDATVVALDKMTGETLWQCKGLDERSGYCSPRLLEWKGLKQIITLTGKSMIGIDPETGVQQWRHPYPASWDIHAVSPLFLDNKIYVSDGYKQGGRMFALENDGKSIKELWRESTLDIHHGGGVLVNGIIYGASSGGTWICLEAATGKVVATHRGVGKGSAVFADGMLFAYGERGRMAIMNADPNDFRVISQFKVEKGNGQHWAHPVIANGRLFIRHGDALMAYNLKP